MRPAPPILACAVLALCACGYDPPMQADHGSDKYRSDLTQCQETARQEADRIVKQRGYLFAGYPISMPLETRSQTRICMRGRGYGLAP